MNNAITGCSPKKTPQNHSRGFHKRARFFEALEGRIFLDSTWNPNVAVGNWNDAANWIGRIPSPNDKVSFNTSATVTFDVNPTIDLLVINGDATKDVKVSFISGGGAHTITITHGTNLYQNAGHEVSLALSDNIAGQSLAVKSAGLCVMPVAGATNVDTGWNKLTVELQDTLDLRNGNYGDGDLNLGWYVTGLTIHGTVFADDVYLMSKNDPTANPIDASSISVDGSLTVTDQLRIGGNGDSDMTVDGGTVNTKVPESEGQGRRVRWAWRVMRVSSWSRSGEMGLG